MNRPGSRRLLRTRACAGPGSLLALALAVGGCVQLKVVAGRPVDPDLLERSLTVGQSSRSDLERELGTPFGMGRILLPFQDAPRTVWSYYYEQGGLEDARRLFLFVFLDGDRYDGYLWFSSLPPEALSTRSRTDR